MSSKKKQDLLLTPTRRRKVLQEALKRDRQKENLSPKLLFGPQRKFALSKSKYVVACCSRRAGKSFAIAFKLLSAALKYPGSIVPYITLTRDSAKLIIWEPIRLLAEAANIKVQFRANNGDVVLSNGSTIILRGVEDRRQAEKLRGPKYPIAVLDEAQGIPSYLKEVIHEILEPAILDYPGSQILVTGTPNAACAGAFFEMWHDPEEAWERHCWTMRDNISFERKGIDVNAEIAKMLKKRGLSTSDPAYLREFEGKWVRDSDSQVYKFDDRINLYSDTAWLTGADDWDYWIGLDLGWNDPSAFVVIGQSQQLGRFDIPECYQASEMSVDALARQYRHYAEKYNHPPIIVDTGGYGKGMSEELIERHALPIHQAQKSNKTAYIETVNNDFRSGAVQIYANGAGNNDLVECLRLLQWSEKSLLTGNPKEDKRSPNHLADALLYGLRATNPFDGDELQFEGPPMGSLEYWNQEMARREAEAVSRYHNRHNEEEYNENFLDNLL